MSKVTVGRENSAEVGGHGAEAGDRGGGRGGDGEVPGGLVGLVADQGAAQGVDVVEVVASPVNVR